MSDRRDQESMGAYGPTSSTMNVTFVAGLASTISSTVVANPAAVTIPGSTTVTVTLAEPGTGNPVRATRRLLSRAPVAPWCRRHR